MNSKFLPYISAIALAAWLLLVVYLVASAPDIPTQNEPVIMEDDPRWECETMGNHLCGPGHHN